MKKPPLKVHLYLPPINTDLRTPCYHGHLFLLTYQIHRGIGRIWRFVFGDNAKIALRVKFNFT